MRQPVESAQYLSGDYRDLIVELGMVQSVGRTGVCWDNSVAEAAWSSLKRELVHRYVFPDRATARRAFSPRTWAVEAAGGLGALLAQQLVAAGETVLDVPPTLSARVRLLDAGRTDKTDPHDARSAAVVALRHGGLRNVTAVDHSAVLRLLADRHHDLTAQRTRVICRLHALMCLLIAGGLSRQLSTGKAAAALRAVRPVELVDIERKRMALDLLADLRRLDSQLATVKDRIAIAVEASATTVTDVYGVGPIVAALLVGHTSDVRRFATAGHFARYNGTAPIEASSGPRVRHRLNPRGNRQLNHALHLAAITQVAHDTPGRVYYDRKLADGKSRKEALRALKRRISDAVYRQLLADSRRWRAGPGGQRERLQWPA